MTTVYSVSSSSIYAVERLYPAPSFNPLGPYPNNREQMPATAVYRDDNEKSDRSRYEMVAWQVPPSEDFPRG